MKKVTPSLRYSAFGPKSVNNTVLFEERQTDPNAASFVCWDCKAGHNFVDVSSTFHKFGTEGGSIAQRKEEGPMGRSKLVHLDQSRESVTDLVHLVSHLIFK